MTIASPAVRELYDVTGLEVRSLVLEKAEVVAGVIMQAIGRHRVVRTS